MMKHRNLALAIAFAIVIAIASCAKQGMPSGGPKDVAPPKVLALQPANESLGFDAKEIAVTFDEYVVLKDVDNNLLVSPPMDPKPEVKTKGKGIVIRLRDTLRGNSTYQLQFLGAIADYNEGNVLEHFSYVFSTGQGLDSMTIRGQVQDALTLKPMEEPLTVLLYAPDSQFSILNSQLAYQTRSLKDGTFQFNHIAGGQYRLLALKDDNKNLLLDTAEACAWVDALVTACPMPRQDTTQKDSTAKSPILNSQFSILNYSAPERERQRVVSADYVSRDRLRVITKVPMRDPLIECDSTLYWQLNPKGDTLLLWPATRVDSLRLVLSDPSGLQDTLRLRCRIRGRGQTHNSLSHNVRGNFDYFDTLRFTATLPFDSMPDTLFHFLSADSTEQGYLTWRECLPQPLRCTAAGSGVGERYLGFRLLWRPQAGGQYTLRLLTLDSATVQLKVTKPEEYGNIHLTVTSPQYLYQLLNEKNEIVQSISNSPSPILHFPHLKPGKYRIRAIEDRDGNGKWTTGDYYLGRQPERVVYFPKTLEVRANWDMEETWEVSGMSASYLPQKGN